jgi:hypothetical protein
MRPYIVVQKMPGPTFLEVGSNAMSPSVYCLLLTYSVALVRKRTILTERPPLVDEVSANFCRQRVPRGQRDRSLRLYSRISRPNLLY